MLPIISGTLSWRFQNTSHPDSMKTSQGGEEWIYLLDGSIHLLPETNSVKMGESVLALKNEKGNSANPTGLDW